jgi:hypothetical protein
MQKKDTSVKAKITYSQNDLSAYYIENLVRILQSQVTVKRTGSADAEVPKPSNA